MVRGKMLDSAPARRAFRARLLAWYRAKQRSLPWRGTHDPYRVWISEVMLQQTRVAVVESYYRRFLARFPTVRHLARARPSTVLALWSGLGYYRRARALHAAARIVVRQHGGSFPRLEVELRELPGIGRYTAAAIASIAFDESTAVVDGNVERVLRRLYGRRVSGEAIWQQANQLLDPASPGNFNQAMMELGATVCLPAQPRCPACPVARWCASFTQEQEKKGKEEKTSRRLPRQRKPVAYRLALRDDAVRLVQRSASDRLMPGMWELPQIISARADRLGGHAAASTLRLKHSITTTDYDVHIAMSRGAETSADVPAKKMGRWVPLSHLPLIPLTGLARKALQRAGVLLK